MNSRANREAHLWPYGITAALPASLIIWILLVLLLTVLQRLAHWPEPAFRPIVLSLTLVASLVPIILVLLDFMRENVNGPGRRKRRQSVADSEWMSQYLQQLVGRFKNLPATIDKQSPSYEEAKSIVEKASSPGNLKDLTWDDVYRLDLALVRLE